MKKENSIAIIIAAVLCLAPFQTKKSMATPPPEPPSSTTRPVSLPAKLKRYKIVIDKNGEIFLLYSEKISIKGIIERLEKLGLKSVRLSIHPAQKLKGELIKTLLKDLRVNFQVEESYKGTALTEKREKKRGEKDIRLVPTSRPGEGIKSERSVAERGTRVSPQLRLLEKLKENFPPKSYFWQAVPLRQPREFEGAPHFYELRGQIVDSEGRPAPQTPLGIILYRNGQRERFGVFPSTDKGLFRIKVPIGVKGKFRISAISESNRFEFDLPLAKPNKVIYVRFTLLKKVIKSRAKVSGGSKGLLVPSKRVRSDRSDSSGQKSAVSNLKRGERAVTKPISSKCNWPKLKLWSKADKKDRQLELRIKFVFPKDRIERSLAVVLARQRGKKLDPFIQARTDKKGCIRILITPRKGENYFIASLLGLRPAMFPLREISAFTPSGIREFIIPLPSEKFGYISFNRLDAVVEVSKEEIRVTHILEFDFREPPKGEKTPEIFFPLAKGSGNVKFDKNYPWLQWELKDGKLLLKKDPPTGRIRLAYASFYPRKDGRFVLDIPLSQEIFQAAVYLSPEIELLDGNKGEKVKVGSGQNAREFLRVTFERLNKKLTIPLKIKERSRGVMAVLSEMKEDPNKRFKLYGLGVLFSVAIAGLFLFFVIPGKRE